MPELPVPEIAILNSFFVEYAYPSSLRISSEVWKKKGSRWPTTGCAIAWYTRGATMLGPGPKRRRLGAWMGGYIKVVSVIVGAAHVVAAPFAEELTFALAETRRTDRTPEHRFVLLLTRHRRFRFAHPADYIDKLDTMSDPLCPTN
jgi:hypothetical protein